MRAPELFARLALAAAFLSAVADRFGLWGGPGDPGVAWGGWAPFVAYTGQLLWFLPAPLVQAAAVTATALEALFGVLLLTPVQPRLVALGSFALLTLFGLSMALSLGVKAPLDYSVFSAAAAACLLWERRSR